MDDAHRHLTPDAAITMCGQGRSDATALKDHNHDRPD